MQEQVNGFSDVLKREIGKREQEVMQEMEAEYKNKSFMAQKEWESKEMVYKLKIENFEDEVKKQNAEITTLRKEQETALKKVQELAVTVIESGASKSKPVEDSKN